MCHKKDGRWIQSNRLDISESHGDTCLDPIKDCLGGKIGQMAWDLIAPKSHCGDQSKEILQKKAIAYLGSEEVLSDLEDYGVFDPKGMLQTLKKMANKMIEKGVTNRPVVKPPKMKSDPVYDATTESWKALDEDLEVFNFLNIPIGSCVDFRKQDVEYDPTRLFC